MRKIFLAISCIFSGITHAETSVMIHNGFVSGNTFRALSETSKNVYATGLVDGILLAPLYGAPEENLDKFESCTTGMTGQQVVAIFEKFLSENPARWHQSMHTLGFSALRQACSK